MIEKIIIVEEIEAESWCNCSRNCKFLKAIPGFGGSAITPSTFQCNLFRVELGDMFPTRRHERCLRAAHPIGGPKKCHDCNAEPGQIHSSGCDTEMCSVCGEQWISCGCKDHDPTFARWSGWWPGGLEAYALEIDLNTFHSRGWAEKLLVKPKPK
jgi:hypothetical protein